MKFTQIPENAFKELVLNAGILLDDFDPATGKVKNEDIIGATTGGLSFTATPTFNDFGEDIDNCPKNMLELKKLDTWEVKLSGTFVTVSTTNAKSMIAAADVDKSDTTKITPRNDITSTDFKTVWLVADYSDQNGDTNGGYVAIKMLNSLSTGGFSFKSTDKGKGNFAFEYTGHYSMTAQSTPPFEVYVKAGTAEAT